jgi:hypothetical protein
MIGPSLTGLRGTQLTGSIIYTLVSKDTFIGRYYPPAKIIALRSNIMKFSQFDNEHVA